MSPWAIHERVRDIQIEKKKTVCSCDVKKVDEDKCESSFVNALDWCTNQQLTSPNISGDLFVHRAALGTSSFVLL
jgi:hypothetical protein